MAKGLKVLMDVVGFSLPSTSLQLEPRTIWVSLLVGTVVTVVSALVPARRATKVLPVEALRESTPGAEKPSLRRGLVGLALVAAGVAGMLSALYGGASMKLFGLGLVAAMVGVMVALPLAVRPLAALIATPMRLRGMPGELAKQNAMRNPRRTSSTAAALMIGLTLVVSMGVFASSLKASFGDVISGQTNADLYLATLQRPGSRVQPVGRSRRSRASTAWTRSPPTAGARRGSPRRTRRFSAVDPATAEDVMNLEVSQGSVGDLGKDGVVVSKAAAATHTAGSSATRSRRSSPRPASTGCTWSASTTARAGSVTTSS